MLTLRAALKFACFEKARVVAGAAGLDREIRRVHVVDIPDATYAWGHDALMLTAGYGLKDSPERQAALIPTLLEHGLAGMVLSTGWYFDAVPPAIRQAAEAHAFPVVELPREVEFIAITEQLYAEIVNREFALKERADDIHRRLTRVVLDGGDLAALTDTLAEILGRSVLIENAASEVLATAQRGPVDEARENVVRAGRTPPERIQRLRQRGVYAELQARKGPVHFDAMPELGMTMERVVAAIVVGREHLGYLWVVAGDHPLTDLDTLAIEHAGTVAALVMLKEQAVHNAQQVLRGDFLSLLLQLEAEPEQELLERGRAMGFQFAQAHQVLFVMPEPAANLSLPELAARIDHWLHAEREWGLAVARERGVALVIRAKAAALGRRLAERLAEALGEGLMIGVSEARASALTLRQSYAEATEAADVGLRLGFRPRLACFFELGLLDWLYRVPPSALRTNPFFVKIEALVEHDLRSNGDLVHTLEAYLDYGGALAEAAAAINVHRNTLLYRLGRIEEIIEVDLKEVWQRLNLHVALKGFRLQP